MMAEFAILPAKQDHLSPAIATAIDELKKCQVHYQLGPMSTSIEGSPDQVFLALRKCYEKLAHSNQRVFMTITLDSSVTNATSLSDRIASVESQFG